jgi:hypothetical protein
VPLDQPPASLRAGFIGLKSPRPHHLKHEDFGVPPSIWQEAAAAFAAKVTALGRRLAAGNFRPDPAGPGENGLSILPLQLVCGFVPALAGREEVTTVARPNYERKSTHQPTRSVIRPWLVEGFHRGPGGLRQDSANRFSPSWPGWTPPRPCWP